MSSSWYFQPVLLLLLASSAQLEAQQVPDFNPAALAKKATPAVVFINGITLNGIVDLRFISAGLPDHQGTLLEALDELQSIENATRQALKDFADACK